MEKELKYLSLSILLSSILISGTLLYNSSFNRYKFSNVNDKPPMVFDSKTGTYYYKATNNGTWMEYNPINKTINKKSD